MSICAAPALSARVYPYGTRHTPEMVADLARRAVARKTGARTKALLETV